MRDTEDGPHMDAYESFFPKANEESCVRPCELSALGPSVSVCVQDVAAMCLGQGLKGQQEQKERSH